MTENNKYPRSSWTRHLVSSVLFGLLGIVLCYEWQANAIMLLLILFILGFGAGWFARRTGWLCGIIVGLPVGLAYLTGLAVNEYGSLPAVFGQPDYWRIAFPAAVAATGMAIMGGVAGAWMHDIRLQRGT